MSESNNSNSGGGVSALGLLGVAFVILKLCGVITWSWWLVTLPFWFGLALVLVLLLAVVALVALGSFVEWVARKGQ